jgi:galactokinase
MQTETEHDRHEQFEHTYGTAPEVVVRAPGRVNLIGDHTDYHEGFVMPMAIDRSILLYGRRRPDPRVRIRSNTLDAGLEIDLGSSERHPEAWAHYFQGVISVLGARYALVNGCDVLIDADLPPGGGLSSSSALVVGFGALLARLNGIDLAPYDLAILGRDAEHWYGTTGGIMDQFVISHASEGNAVVLDCRSLSYEYAPMPKDATVVIANTNTQHNQIKSPYAQRRREAEAGLRVLQARVPKVKTLRDVDPDALERHRADLLAEDPTGVLWRRCRHVVSENARVLAAVSAFKQDDLRSAGALMAQSHASLRDDYEVSSAELDAMVAAAEQSPGYVGARMTGGGFGGCTVNLVANDAVAPFCQNVGDQYLSATGVEPLIFTTRPQDGVRVIELYNVQEG